MRREPLIVQPIIIALLTTLAGVVFAFLKMKDLPSQVPIFYSLPRASERLGNKEWLYILPGASFAILVLNTFFAFIFIERDTVLTRVLALTALLIALLSLYSLLRIIFLIV